MHVAYSHAGVLSVKLSGIALHAIDLWFSPQSSAKGFGEASSEKARELLPEGAGNPGMTGQMI